MGVEQICEEIGQRLLPVDPAVREEVQHLLLDPATAIETIRRARRAEPGLLAAVAVRMLPGEDNPRRRQRLATLLTEEGLWMEVLLQEPFLDQPSATAVFETLAKSMPLLDAALLSRLVDSASGDVRAIEEARALRALTMVERVSNGKCLLPLLTKLLRHPSPQVQSKVALLMGRANYSLGRLTALLDSKDSRVRANAIEAIWQTDEPALRPLLWKAVDDPAVRVRVNALVGLALQRDERAVDMLKDLAEGEEPSVRVAATWGLARLARPDLEPLLTRLASDKDPGVRKMAERRLHPDPG